LLRKLVLDTLRSLAVVVLLTVLMEVEYVAGRWWWTTLNEERVKE